MTTELSVTYKWQDEELVLTKSDVRNLISTSTAVTDKEILLFMKLCKYQKLNPFIREAYLIKYGTSPANLVTGVEVFTKRAENNPDFGGIIRTNNYDETDDRGKWWSQVDVYRKNLIKPITTRVYYEEYVGTDKYGKVTKMWNNKARTMLDKVALMQGLRLAFPTALGGLYEEHELDQQAEPKDISPPPETENEERIEVENEIHVEGEKVVDAEFIEEEKEEKPMQRTKEQNTYIKAILKGDILTEEERKNLNDAYTKSDIHKAQAEAIIKRYEILKAEREPLVKDDGVTHDYVSLIIAQKKKLYIPSIIINKWAGTEKLEDLQDLPVPKLEEILELAKNYHKSS